MGNARRTPTGWTCNLKDEKNAALFEDCDGIVFVIDAQNELAEVKEAVSTMLFAVEKAHRFVGSGRQIQAEKLGFFLYSTRRLKTRERELDI